MREDKAPWVKLGLWRAGAAVAMRWMEEVCGGWMGVPGCVLPGFLGVGLEGLAEWVEALEEFCVWLEEIMRERKRRRREEREEKEKKEEKESRDVGKEAGGEGGRGVDEMVGEEIGQDVGEEVGQGVCEEVGDD
ncbi:hypothetical protein BJ508DRAFT_307506 [Ascobolus immersus RN42]|uniref:Uncharacterized protein n=1 Tax=Ascobolus immersus RN42 TaxID=1160509 RepID=A0A3N4I2G4_ASCIM|nr:hypothetical protein BJ508DRAFT_307506 [Ascobolus immersus RN42]